LPKKRLIYEEPQPTPRSEIQRKLAAGAPEEVERTLVSVAFHEENFDIALQAVLSCADSPNASIRGTAILCLGHLARIHGQLPEEPVTDIVRSGLRDRSEYVRGQAENAADDIEIFVPSVGRSIRGH